MIMLTYWKNKNLREYDKAIYTSASVPARCTQPGIEHWKQLAPSGELCKLWGKVPETDWGAKYAEELRTVLLPELMKLVELSESGMWIQVLFFEESQEDGERPWMYQVLKELGTDVYIE